jgi:hypothetical protein
MRFRSTALFLYVALLASSAGCSAKGNYALSWTIEEARPGSGRQLIAANEGRAVPRGWTATGKEVRVLEEPPTAPHDTVGILYWWHSEVPLKMKSEGTQCEAVSRAGSVATSRVCASTIYSVETQCGKGCRRDIVRAIADSLGAESIIVAEERLKFEGEDGQPASVPQAYAQNEGFRGTYVMIRMR